MHVVRQFAKIKVFHLLCAAGYFGILSKQKVHKELLVLKCARLFVSIFVIYFVGCLIIFVLKKH